MAMINYANKVALNSNSNIANINKVNATDMNELKNAFNNQVAQGWYKTGINPTFTFASYDSETLTGVVSSNLNMTPYLNVGMKVKFTQNSAIKYAFITAITSTKLTLFLGTDYSINSSAISNTYFSMLKAPYGFPINPDKWTIYNSLIASTQLNPAQNVIYNLSGYSIIAPIGCFDISLKCNTYSNRNSAGASSMTVGISTANNSFNDSDLRILTFAQDILGFMNAVYLEKKGLQFSSITPLFINIRTEYTGMASIGFFSLPVVLKLVCSYL